MKNTAQSTEVAPDQAFIAAIVRKVIDRLQQAEATRSSTPLVIANSNVVTVETIQQHSGTPLIVAMSAVITPAARDEARRRGISIERRAGTTAATNVTPAAATGDNIIDSQDADRAHAVRHQLSRRGVHLGAMRIVLTDQPAREVHDQVIAGNRAAMVTAIADVQRFASELSPNVWVLDMKRFNIPAAVNVAVKIALLGAR